MLNNWRDIKVGTDLRFYGTEFDGSWDEPCVVTDRYNDHLIADAAGSHLWIDDDSMHMFREA